MSRSWKTILLIPIGLVFITAILPGETIRVTEPIILFNGKNLDGFYNWLVDSNYEDPRGVFSVTNGMIRISGDGLGYLATQKAFKDYRLILEFKWGRTNWAWGDRIGKARDSGLFLHATGPDGNSHDGDGAFMAAIECNIFQGATGDILLIRGNASDGSLIAPRVTVETARELDEENWPYWKNGGEKRAIETWGRINWFGKDPGWKDELDFRGKNEVENPPGQWNRLECVAKNGTIQIHLNGVLVNEAKNVWPRSGKILLQCEGSEIFFRRLELQPFD
jgi:hypothetical protein